MEVSAGASWKALPNTIAYEGPIPLTYTASWSSIKPEPQRRTNCQKNKEPSTVTCKATKFMEEVGEAVNKEIQTLIDSWETTYLRNPAKSKRAISLSFIADCLN